MFVKQISSWILQNGNISSLRFNVNVKNTILTLRRFKSCCSGNDVTYRRQYNKHRPIKGQEFTRVIGL